LRNDRHLACSGCDAGLSDAKWAPEFDVKFSSAIYRIILSVLCFLMAGFSFYNISLPFILSDFQFALEKEELEKENFENTLFFQIRFFEPSDNERAAVASFKTLYTEGFESNVSKSIVGFALHPRNGAIIILSDVKSVPDACFSDSDIGIKDITKSIRIINKQEFNDRVWTFSPKSKFLRGKKFSIIEIDRADDAVAIYCIIDDIWNRSSFVDRRMNIHYLLPGDHLTYQRRGVRDFFRYTGLWSFDSNRQTYPADRVEWLFDIRGAENFDFRGGSPIDSASSISRALVPSDRTSIKWENQRMAEWKELIWIFIGAFVAIGLTMLGSALRIFILNLSAQ
jgi:hypothetical protein